MNVLAFDTCFGACSVVAAARYGQPDQRIERLFEAMEKGQAERLLPMIAEALANAGIAPAEVTRIGTTIGPGTFTGTRIGVSAARALALVTGAPIVTLSSLEVIALNPAVIRPKPEAGILVAMNANRGEAYVQCFPANDWAARSAPVLCRVEAAASLMKGPMVVVGTAAGLVMQSLDGRTSEAVLGPVAVQPSIGDAASHIASLATSLATSLAASLAVSGEILALRPRPLYLRPPDAKEQAGKSLARRS